MNVYTDLEIGKEYLYKSEVEETKFTVLNVVKNNHVLIQLANGEESFLFSGDNDCVFN